MDAIKKGLSKALTDYRYGYNPGLANDMFIKISTMSHPFPVTQEHEAAWYDSILTKTDNSKVYFAICEVASSELIGYLSLVNIDWLNRNCYWGAVIGKHENQGVGYGREAVSLAIGYAFSHLNMHIVYASVRADHPALKTWLNTGAKIEGTLKQHYWDSGVYLDVHVLAWYPNMLVDSAQK